MSACLPIELREVMVLDLDPHRVEAEHSYPNVGIYSFGRGTFAKPPIEAATTSANTLYRIRPGQLIYSRLFAFEGAYTVVPDEHDGAYVSNEFPTFTLDRERIEPDYLRWLFRWPETWRQLRAGAVGMGDRRQRIHPDRLLAHRILLPPLSAQKQLIDRLAAVAKLGSNQRRLSDQVEGETAALLRANFRRLIGGAKLRPFSEIAPLVRRPVIVADDKSYPELGVRSFGRGSFHKPGLAGEDVGSKRLFEIRTGDLLFNIVFAWEGAVAVASAEDDGRVGSHRFLTMVPDPKIATANFLRFWFLSEDGLAALNAASPGGAGRNRTLGLKGLQAIEVPLPPIDDQTWFDRMQDFSASLSRARIEAKIQHDALIPAMLNATFAPAD